MDGVTLRSTLTPPSALDMVRALIPACATMDANPLAHQLDALISGLDDSDLGERLYAALPSYIDGMPSDRLCDATYLAEQRTAEDEPALHGHPNDPWSDHDGRWERWSEAQADDVDEAVREWRSDEAARLRAIEQVLIREMVR